MLKIKIYTIILIVLNAILWLVIVPMWHFPDEQSHFGEVAYLAEKNEIPQGDLPDLTEEIYISEVYLGTARDKFGRNLFTFHPEYRIEYTETFEGKYEKEIKDLNNTESKTKFVKAESSHYPKLYYVPASLLYKLFYNQDLFVRVFVVRFWSLFLFTLTVCFSYGIGLLIFPKHRIYASVLAILTAFQPMMVFSNIGVNSDALGNLVFTAFIYYCLTLIKSGFSLKNIIVLIGVSILSIYTKPQFIVTIPIILILFIFIYIRDNKKTPWSKIIIGSAVLLFITHLLLNLMRLGTVNLIIEAVARFNLESFIKFSKEYTLTHTISEVLPWYWGIYDWLGVTYPRSVHRIINRIVAVSLIGFCFWLIRSFRRENRKKKEIQSIYFLIVMNLIFFGSLAVYDWYSWYTTKYQLGIQGRYYFPLITSHMVILLLGWQSLFAWVKKLKYFPILLLEISMIVLNFIALYTVSVTYYDLSFISSFARQVSQYKPWFAKAPVLFLVFILLLLAVAKVIYLQAVAFKKRFDRDAV